MIIILFAPPWSSLIELKKFSTFSEVKKFNSNSYNFSSRYIGIIYFFYGDWRAIK